MVKRPPMVGLLSMRRGRSRVGEPEAGLGSRKPGWEAGGRVGKPEAGLGSRKPEAGLGSRKPGWEAGSRVEKPGWEAGSRPFAYEGTFMLSPPGPGEVRLQMWI